MRLREFLDKSNEVAGISFTKSFCGKTLSIIENTIYVDNEPTSYSSIEEAEATIMRELKFAQHSKSLKEQPATPNAPIIEAIQEFGGQSNFEVISEIKSKIASKEFSGNPIVDSLRLADVEDRIVEGRLEYVLKDDSRVAISETEVFKILASVKENKQYIDYMTESTDNFIEVVDVIEDHHQLTMDGKEDDIEIGYRFHCYLTKIDIAVRAFASELNFYKIDQASDFAKTYSAGWCFPETFNNKQNEMLKLFSEAPDRTKNSLSKIAGWCIKTKDKKAKKIIYGVYPLDDGGSGYFPSAEAYDDATLNKYAKKLWSSWETMRHNLIELFDATNDKSESGVESAVRNYGNSFYAMRLLIADLEKYIRENRPVQEGENIDWEAIAEGSFDPDVGAHATLAKKAKKLGDTGNSNKDGVIIKHDKDSASHSKNAMSLVHNHEGVKSLDWKKRKNSTKKSITHTADTGSHTYTIRHEKAGQYTKPFTLIMKTQNYKSKIADKQDRKANLGSNKG